MLPFPRKIRRASSLILAAALQGFACAQQPLPNALTYEVIAIRPSAADAVGISVGTNKNTFNAKNVEIKLLLLQAYGLQIEQQLANLPTWTNGLHYDLSAKMDADTAAQLDALPLKDRVDAANRMLLTILVDRFGLKAHRELRDLPEYALVQARGGSTLKPADATNPKAHGMSVFNGKMEAYSAELKQLMYFLSYQVHRPIVDRTGLTGTFDLKLEWTPDDVASAPGGSGADAAADKVPGLFTALQEQLGLKLESIKGPVEVVVVDHLEQPTEN